MYLHIYVLQLHRYVYIVYLHYIFIPVIYNIKPVKTCIIGSPTIDGTPMKYYSSYAITKQYNTFTY